MNIGWFSYAPGLQGVSKNSAGNSEWTRHLINLYNKSGHTVTWLSDDNPPGGTIPKDNINKIDVAIFNWRWPMPDYPERQALYSLQMKLLNLFFSKNKKVIIHDQDHKISSDELDFLKSNNALLYAPELNPRPGFNNLFYPNPYESLYGFRNKAPFLSIPDLCYVGNVYERYDQAVEYFKKISKAFKVEIFGNWLEEGPDRPGEKVVRADLPNAYFGGRLSQSNVLEKLICATATVHLFKPSYAETGFVTFRWIEAAVAHTFAFVPNEFWLPKEIKEKWLKLGVIVENGEQMYVNYKNLTTEAWKEAITSQRDFVFSISNSDQWLSILEN